MVCVRNQCCCTNPSGTVPSHPSSPQPSRARIAPYHTIQQYLLCDTENSAGDVSYGSFSDLRAFLRDVRFTPTRRHHRARASGPKSANNGSWTISLDQLIGAVGPHFRIAKMAPISGAGDLISTTTESSMASNPWRTPLGCRQTSPGPMMNSSEPTVDFTLPFTT
jgi:hypothetical protein